MVERWSRIILRIVRALTELRRRSVVLQANQVNIAAQQQVVNQ